MGRRLRTGHLTSGKRAVQPWMTEASSNLILVHLGGIHDEELLAAGRGYAAARRNMDVKSSTNGLSTTSTVGSAKSSEGPSGIIGNTPTVYWKNGYGMATNEDETASRTVPYPRGLFNGGGYIVLRRAASANSSAGYWSMGVFTENNYEPTQQDYVIAYVAGNDVTQIWSSDIKYTDTQGSDHPFKVKFEGIVNAGGEDEQAIFSVVPGTINNKVPSNIYEPIAISEEEKYVYLAAYTDVGESDEYLITSQILADVDGNKADTDDYGYLKLAKISPDGTVTQYVSGSVWSERHKYTEPDSATYYYYRV